MEPNAPNAPDGQLVPHNARVPQARHEPHGPIRPAVIVPDDEIDLRDVWNLLLRNRWLIAGCLAAVVALAAAYTVLSTPIFEATTSIRIDEQKSGAVVLDILETLSTGSEVDTEMEVLRSRTLAEAVVEELGLQVVLRDPARVARAEVFAAVHADRAAPPGEYAARLGDDGRFTIEDRETGEPVGTFAPGEPIALAGATITLAPGAVAYDALRFDVVEFPRAVAALRRDLSVNRPNRDANVVVVRYESPDTVLVRQVPNALAQTFIERRQQVHKTEATSTVEFLREQIDAITAQLAAAEDLLQAFREDEQVVSLEAQASAQVTRLADLQAQRSGLEAERAALARLLADIDSTAVQDPAAPSPYRRLIGFHTLLRNQAASQILGSIAAVEDERAALLQRRTMADPNVQVLTGRIRDLEAQLRSIATTYLEGLTNHVASLDAALQRFGEQLEEIPAREVQFARLERQTSVLEEIYLLLQTRLKEAEIAQAVEDPSVRIVDPAARPDEPIKPRMMLNLALALVLGTMLGVGAAFLREYMDTTVHTREDVQEAAGVPVLGLIPSIRAAAPGLNGRGRKGTAVARGTESLGGRLVAGRDPRSPVSEAYRSLRTNITFARPERPPRAIVFTSPTPSDGKTTSAANLAVTLVQQGLRVLLVDADLRRGVLHEVFGTQREPGLSNLLLGAVGRAHGPATGPGAGPATGPAAGPGADPAAGPGRDTGPGRGAGRDTAPEAAANPADAIHRVQLGESGAVDFLATGTLPPNPAELLGSERMHALLRRLEDAYDAVILDAPPLNLVTDAAVLGTNADGVILVARAAQTDKGALAYAIEQLRNVRAPILGAVLNDVDFKRDARYSSGYGSFGAYYRYYYGEEVG